MKALLKRVGQEAEVVEIENTLGALQSAVGGYIETLGVFPGIVAVVDEEGLLKVKTPNIAPNGILLVGDVVFVGVVGENFRSLTDEEVERLKLYSKLWEVKQ